MPLKIELKPDERLIIGNAAIRNGPRRASFVIETNTKFLRETDIITASEADTPCKQLYFALTVMYLADDPTLAENSFVEQANALMEAAPSMRPYIAAIYDQIQAGDLYRALKRGKDLLAYEEKLRSLLDTAGEPATAP
ncbi:flagellar biosynthesis repressor FlbT [Methylobacterium persicinum]|uniref:Flagellar protein FlbT n=1 Tax=Methylobacterium persicinum TaxID=374426 RepID=A0ABU0HIX8_9HYPH|nr:flagellar biosynthesis repressor FlbT [Methylobacterium persicinum]MDQ0442279.1 flagellar protein FlbT [Methylobacterium persicinum]GJE37262.1 flagellum biosynthesis repressor protein FlbT [Methylobacterium persicinum]